MKCIKCGKQINKKLNKCPFCGALLHEEKKDITKEEKIAKGVFGAETAAIAGTMFASKTKAEIEENQIKSFEGNVVVNKENAANKESVNNSNTNNSSVNSSSDLSTTTSSSNLNDPFSFSASAPIYQSSPDNSSTYDATYNTSNDDNYRIVNDFLNENINKEIEKFDLDSLTIEQKQEVTQNVYDSIRDYIKELIDSGEIEVEGDLTDEELNKLIAQFLSGDNSNQDNGDLVVLDRSKIEEEFTRIINENLEEYGIKIDFKLSENVLNLEDIEIIEKDGNRTYKDKEGNIYNSLEELVVAHPELIDVLKVIEENSEDEEKNDLEDENAGGGYAGGVISIDYAALGSAIAILGGPSITGQDNAKNKGKTGWNYLQNKASDLNKVFEKFQTGENKTSQHGATYNFSISGTKYASSFSSMCSSISKIGVKGSGSGYNSFLANLHKQLVNLKEKMDDSNKDKDGKEIFSDSEKTLMNYAFDLTASEYAAGYGAMLGQSEAVIANWMDTFNTSAQKRKDDFYKELDKTNRKTFDSNYKNIIDAMLEQEYAAKWAEEHGNEYPSKSDRKSSKYKKGLASYKEKNKQAYNKDSKKYKEYRKKFLESQSSYYKNLEENNIRLKDYHAQSAVIENLAKEYENSQKLLSLEEEIKELDRLLAERKITKKEYLSAKLEIESEMKKYDDHFDAIRVLGSTNEERALYEKYYNEVMNENASSIEVLAILDDYDKLLANYSDLDEKTKSVVDKATEFKNSQARLAELNGLEHLTEKQEKEKKELEKITGQYSGVASALYYYQNATRVFMEYAENLREHGFTVEDNELQIILLTQKLDNMAQANNEAAILVKKINDNLATEEDKKRLEQIGKDYGVLTKEVDGVLTIYRNNDPTNGTVFGLTEEESALYFSKYANEVLPKIKVQSMVNNISEWAIKDRKGELSGKDLEYFHQAQEILKARSTLEKYADLETIPPYLEEEINKARELIYNFSVADQIAFQHMESARLNLDFYSNIGEYFKSQDDVRAFNIAKQMFENNQELCQIEMGSNDNSAHYQAKKDELHTTAAVSEQDKQWLEENYGDSIKLWNLINNFDELKGEYDSKLVAEAKKVLDAKAQLERYDELYGRRTKLTAEEKEEYNALKTQLSTIKSNANPFSDIELAIFGYSDTARVYDEIRTNYLSSGYAVENKDLDIIKLVDDMNSQSTAYYRKVFLERELQNNTSLTASERQKYETELEGLKDAKPVVLTKEQSNLYMGRYANEILPAVKVQTAVYNYEEWQEKYNNGKLTKAEEEIYLQATEIVDARRYLELKDKEKLTTEEKNELSRLESKIDTDTATTKAYPFSQVEQLAFSNMENARMFMEFGNNLNRYGYAVENKDLDVVLLTDSICNQAISYYNAQEEIKEISDKLANSHLSDRDRTNYERRLTELYKIEKPRLTEEQNNVYSEQYTKILPAIKTQSILYNYEEWQEKYNNNELTDAETKEFLRAKVIIDSRKEYNRFLELQDFKNQRELTPEELKEYNRINSHMDIIESNINPFSQVEQIAFSNMENSRLYFEFGNNLAKYGYAVSNKDIQIVLLTNKLYTMSENNLEISDIMSRIALGQATEEDVKKLEEYNKIKQDGLTEEESKLYFSEYAQKVLPKIKTQEIINNYSEWQEKYANGTLSKEEQELYSQATQIISAKGQYKRYLELKDKTTLSTSETKELEKLESKIDSIYSNANKFSVVDQLAYYNISNANMYMASSREMQTVLRIISGTNFETQVLSSNNDDITIYTPVISEENQEYIDNYYKNSHALQVQNAILHLDELDPNSALYKEAQEAQEAQSKIEKYQTLKGIEASEQELSSEQKSELASIEKDLKTIVDNACFLSSSEQLIFSYMRSIELNNEYLSVSKELEEAKQIQALRDETTLNVYATRKQTVEFFENHPEAVEIDDKVATLEEQLKDIEYNRNVSRLDMIRINEMSSGNLDGFISSDDIHNYLLANNAEYNQLSFDVDNYILEKTKEQQSENLSAINKATSDSNWFKILSVIGNAFNAQYHDPAGEALSKLILKDKYIEPERMGADGLTDSQREIFENKYGLVIEYGLENAILNRKIEQTAADQIKCILNAQDKSLFSGDIGVDHFVKIPDPETSTFQMYFYDKDGKLVKNKDQIALYCISNGIDATGLDVSGNIKKYTDNLNALVAGSKENNYNYTTEQALQCYSYLMNKYGIDEATEIFSIFNDTGAKIIGYELGQERYAKMKEAFENTSGFWSDAGKFAYMAGYSLYDGVNGWADNFINIFAADGRKTAKDYKIEKFLNDVTLDDDFASYLINEYEIGSSIGNMLPSIVATLGISVATGGLGLPETALKSFQFLASFATMGLSAAGGTKQQAMIEGMDEATATIYGLLSGLSETTMEAVLGKLPGLSMLNESFEGAKGLAGVFTKMLSEGFEESVQEVYDAFLSSVFTGESVVVDPNAVLKAGLYGAITSGVMSVAGGVASQGLNIVNVGIDLASYAVLDSPSALKYLNNKYRGSNIIKLFTSQELRSDLRFMNQIRNNLKEKIAVAEVNPELKAKYDQLVANGEINSEKIKYSDYALEEAYAALNLEQAIINARNESLNYGHDSIAALTDDRIANILTERQETLDSLKEKREQYIKLQRDLGLTNDQVSELLNNNKEGILNIAAESKLINLHAEISELLSELNKSNDYVYDNYLSIRDTLLNLESSIENDSSLATRENTDTISKLKHQLELFENITSINDDILLKSTTEQEINDTLLYNEKLLAERLLTLQKVNEKLDENNQIIQDINPEEKNNTEFDKLNKDIESLEVLKEKLDREIEVLGKRLETTLDSRDTIATLLSEDNSRINTILEDYRTQLESIEQKNVELRERLKKENDFTILSNIEKEIQSNDTEIEKLEKQVSNLQETIDKNNTEIEKLTNGKIIGINNGSDTQTSQVLRAISGDTVLMGLIPNNLRQMLGVVDNTPENNNAPGNTNAPVIDGRSDRSTMDDRAASDIKFNDEVIHDEQSSQDEVPVLKPDISLVVNRMLENIELTDEVLDRCGITLLTNIHKLSNESVKNRVLEYYQSESIDTSTLSDEAIYEIIENPVFIDLFSKTSFIDEVISRDLNVNRIISSMPKESLQRIIYSVNDMQTYADFVNKISDIEVVRNILSSGFKNTENIIDHLNEKMLDEVISNNLLSKENIEDLIVRIIDKKSNIDVNKLFNDLTVEQVKEYELFFRTGLTEYGRKNLIPLLNANNILKIKEFYGNVIYSRLTYQQLVELESIGNSEFIDYLTNLQKAIYIINSKYDSYIEHVSNPRNLIGVYYTVNRADGSKCKIGLSNIINNNGKPIYVYNINGSMYYSTTNIASITANSRDFLYNEVADEFLSESRLDSILASDRFLGKIEVKDGKFTINMDEKSEVLSIVDTYVNEDTNFYEHLRDSNTRKQFGTNQRVREVNRTRNFVTEDGVDSGIDIGSYTRLVEHFKNKYNLSEQETINTLLNVIDNEAGACSYADLTNVIFSTFKNNVSAFKKTFGFDMYEFENGKKTLNYRMLLMDMYIRMNSTDLSVYDGAHHPRIFSIDPVTNERIINARVDENGKIKVDRFGNIEYCTDKEQVYASRGGILTSAAIKYLNDYGIEIENNANLNYFDKDGSLDIDRLKQDLRRRILNGEHLSLTERIKTINTKDKNGKTIRVVDQSQKNLIFHNLDGERNTEILNWKEGAGHVTTIVGLTEDGVIVVSWGMKHEIKFSDLTQYNCRFTTTNLNTPLLRTIAENSVRYQELANMDIVTLATEIRTDDSIDLDYILKNYLSHETISGLIDEMGANEVLSRVRSARSVNTILEIIRNQISKEEFLQTLSNLTTEQKLLLIRNDDINNELKLDVVNSATTGNELAYAMIELYDAFSSEDFNNFRQNLTTSQMRLLVESDILGEREKIGYVRNAHMSPESVIKYFDDNVDQLLSYANEYYDSNTEYSQFLNKLSFDQLTDTVIYYKATSLHIDALINKSENSSLLTDIFFNDIGKNDLYEYLMSKSSNEIERIASKLTEDGKTKLNNIIQKGIDSLFDEEATLERTFELNEENIENKINDESIILNSSEVIDEGSMIREYSEVNKSTLKESVLAKIKPEMSEFEKARLIYLELGKKLDYSALYRYSLSKEGSAYYESEYNRKLTIDEVEKTGCICATWAQIYSEMLIAAGFKPESIVVQRLMYDDNSYVYNSHAAMYVILEDGSLIVPDMTIPLGHPDYYNIKVGRPTTGFMYLSSEQIKSKYWHDSEFANVTKESRISPFNYRLEFMDGVNDNISEEVRDIIDEFGSYFYGWVLPNPDGNIKYNIDKAKLAKQKAIFKIINEGNTDAILNVDSRISPLLSVSDYFIKELTEELIESRTENDLELFDSLSLLGNIKLEDIKGLPGLLEALPTLFGIDNVRNRNIGTLQQYMRDVASQEDLLTGGRNNKTITIGLNNKTQNNALNINIYETDANGKSVLVTSFGIRVDENNQYVIYSNTIATKINKLLESSDRTEVTRILESLTPSELLTLENIGVNVSEYIDMNTQKIIEAQNLVEIGATESIATRVSNIVTDIEKQVDSNQILDSQKIRLTKSLINLKNSINNKLSTITNSISKIYSRIVNSINNLISKLDSKPTNISDNIIDNILNGREIDESVKERLLTTREFNRLIQGYNTDSNKLEFEERLNSIIQNVIIELDIQNKLNSGIDFDNTIERLSTIPGESIVRILNSLDKELFTKCITSIDSDILSNIHFNYELINKIPKEVFKTLFESNTFVKNNLGLIAPSYSKFDLTADEVASRVLQIDNYSLFIDEGYIDLISEIKDIKLIRSLLDADGNYKKVYFILDYTTDEIFNELIKDKEFVNEHKYDLIDLTRENLDSDTILSNMEIDDFLANTISAFPNFVNNIKSIDNIKKLINSYSNNEYKIRFLDKVNTDLNNGFISNYVIDFLNSLSTDEFNELYRNIDVDFVSLIIKTGIREYNNQILNKVFMSNNINSLTSSNILYLYQTNNDYIKYIDGNNLIDLYLSTNDTKILDYIKENPRLLHANRFNIKIGDSELTYLGVLTIDGRKVYEYKYNNKVLYTDSELFTLCLSEGAKVIDLIKEELITKDTSFVGRITSDLRYEFDSEMSDLIESRINTGLIEKEIFFEKHRHGNKRSTLGTNQKIKRSERIYSFIRRNNYGQIGPSQINTPSFRRFVDHFSSKYNMTEGLIVETINNIIDSQKGACSYANLCNVILWIFRNNPEGFKRRFGFDMYEYENGVRVLNTRALLFDMYLFFNSSDTNPNGRIFTIDTDGKRKLNIINEDGKFRTANSKEQVYACNIDGYYQIAFDYLRHYGIETEGSKLTLSYNEDGSVDIDLLKNDIKRRLANGEILSLTERVEMDTDKKGNKVVSKDAHELVLYNLDETNDYSSTFNWNEGGAHITTIIGANEDGLIVITWGHKALIRYSDLYSDNSAIFSLNLEMNSEENIQVTRNKIKELIAKKDYLQVIRGLESNIINLDTLELTDNKELLIELLNNMEPNSILKYTSDPEILLEYYNLIVDNPEIVNEFINSMSLEQKINLYYNSYNEIKLKELIIRSLTKEELESISDNDYTFIKSIEVYLTEKQKSYIKEQTEISSKQSLMEKLLGVKKNDEVLHYYIESDIIEANNSSSEHNQSAIIEIDDSEDVGAVNSSPRKLDGLQKSSIVDYFSKASSNLKTRIIESSDTIVNGFPENMIVETNGIIIEMSGHKEGDRIIGCLKHANEIVESVLMNYSVSINKADLDELLNIAKEQKRDFKGTFKLAPNGDYLIEVNGGYGTNNQLYTDLKNFLENNEKAKSIIAKIDSSIAESIGQSNYCANKDTLTGKYRLESLLISAGIIDENGNLTQNYQNETEIIDILQKIKKNKGIIDSSDLNKIRNIARLATMHLYMNAIDKCINQQNNSEKYKYSSSKYSRGLKILVDANANANGNYRFIIEILGNDISPTSKKTFHIDKKIFHMYPTSERVNSNALAPIISSIEWYIKEISKRISNDEAIKPSNSKEYKMIVKQELINTMILDSTDAGYTSTFFHITISNMIEELFNFDGGKNLGLNKYLDEMYENPELKINLMQMQERMKDSVYAKVDENNLTLISKVYESIITIIIKDKVFNVFSTDEDIKNYILSYLPNSQLAEKAFDELMKNIDFQNMLKNGKINTCTEEELKDLIGWWSYE